MPLLRNISFRINREGGLKNITYLSKVWYNNTSKPKAISLKHSINMPHSGLGGLKASLGSFTIPKL